MEIKLHTNIDSVARVNGTQSKASRPIDADSDLSVFDHSRALEARLKDLPDVRPEKVAHAKKLIDGPEYPPRETIQKIAALLAMKETKTGQ
jgi:ribosomal 50S subunit-recycling heat shock protein